MIKKYKGFEISVERHKTTYLPKVTTYVTFDIIRIEDGWILDGGHHDDLSVRAVVKECMDAVDDFLKNPEMYIDPGIQG